MTVIKSGSEGGYSALVCMVSKFLEANDFIRRGQIFLWGTKKLSVVTALRIPAAINALL